MGSNFSFCYKGITLKSKEEKTQTAQAKEYW